MRWMTAFLALVLLMTLSSCATIYLDSRNLGVPVEMNDARAEQYTVIEEFRIKDKAGWVIIVPANLPAGDNQKYFEKMLRDKVAAAGGDAIVDLTVKVQNDVLDILSGIVTLGIYYTRSVIIEGKVVKYN